MNKIIISAHDELFNKISQAITAQQRQNTALFSFDSRERLQHFLLRDQDLKLLFFEAKTAADLCYAEYLRQQKYQIVIILLSASQPLQADYKKSHSPLLFWDLSLDLPLEILVENALKYTFYPAPDRIEVNGSRFAPQEIFFIETCFEHRNCVTVHGQSERIVRAPLKDFENLRDYLVKIDRSLIVNLNEIKELDEVGLLVHFKRSSQTARVSQANIKKLQRYLQEFAPA